MEINRALIYFLRSAEVDDLLGQVGKLAKQDVIGFSDLPRFLTEEIILKLSSTPALQPTSDALCNGFSLMMNPLVDIQFPTAKQLQLQLLFTLPPVRSTKVVCPIQQLVPISYRINNQCYSGTIPRQDLLLLICQEKRYVITNSELSHCTQNSETILCPHDLLATVHSPSWLGKKWCPQSKLFFNHTHTTMPNCNNLRTMVHSGSRFYLATDDTDLSHFSTVTALRFSLCHRSVFQFSVIFLFIQNPLVSPSALNT